MSLTIYYREQLRRIRPGRAGTYAAKVKVTHGDDATNWLDLNDETARELIRWLSEYYNVTDHSKLLNEVDTTFAVLAIGADHGITPQAKEAITDTWQKVRAAIGRPVPEGWKAIE